MVPPMLKPSPAIASCTALLPAAVDPVRRRRPVGGVRVRLGFPSPSEDFEDDAVDLNELLVRNEPATFFYRAVGDSMLLEGIRDGDFLVVDRSVAVVDGDLVLATWDGNGPVCKVLRVRRDHVELHSAHPDVPPIVLPADATVELLAVVGVARKVVRRRVRAL